MKEYPLESLVGKVLSPFEQFLRRTTAGGIVLVGTTAIALLLATMFGAEKFHDFWEHEAGLQGVRYDLVLSLHHWVNDALMALFFLLVGLELKRQVLVGELASIRDAALPVVAAVGGMLVPALIYLALNWGTPHASGWGIPMATDIAFAVGILVLLAWRVPKNLVVFLTALAIADDLGAVLVIAIFYTAQIDQAALVASAVFAAVLVLFNRGGIRKPLPYWIVGTMLWYAVHASGVHATLAGIILAMTVPARAAESPARFEERIDRLKAAFHDNRVAAGTDDVLQDANMSSIAEAVEKAAAHVQSPLQRMEHALTPWVTFVVIPIFALANAGIDLASVPWAEALGSRVTLGVFLGLVAGKFVGIALFSWIAVRLGLGRLPTGVTWMHLLGASWLAGIGFTMSIFIGQLAFTDALAVEEAKLGILLGSAVAAVAGLAWLYFSSSGKPPEE